MKKITTNLKESIMPEQDEKTSTQLSDDLSPDAKWASYVTRHCDVTVEQAGLIAEQGKKIFEFSSAFARKNPVATPDMFCSEFRKQFGSGKYELINTEACVDYYLKWQMVQSNKAFLNRGAFTIELPDNPTNTSSTSGPMMLCKYLITPPPTIGTSKKKPVGAISRLSSHHIGEKTNRVAAMGITTPDELDLFKLEEGEFQDLQGHNKALPNFFRHDAEQSGVHECFKHYHSCLIKEDNHYVWLRKTETEPFDVFGDPVGTVKHTVNYFNKGKVGVYQRTGEDKLPGVVKDEALNIVKKYLEEQQKGGLLTEVFRKKMYGTSKTGSQSLEKAKNFHELLARVKYISSKSKSSGLSDSEFTGLCIKLEEYRKEMYGNTINKVVK